MDVHCWRVGLNVSPGVYARLETTLAEEERGRSARFHCEPDRRRFVVAHGALREILARSLETDPGRVRYVYNAFGKPALDPGLGSRVTFNLSHSRDCALVAVAVAADVGVDVEFVRPLPDHADIARRFFPAAHADHLTRLPGERQARAFFRYWTAHEADGKARGEGLGLGDGRGPTAPGGRWSRWVIRPARGYIGAVVVEGSGWRLRQLQWQASS